MAQYSSVAARRRGCGRAFSKRRTMDLGTSDAVTHTHNPRFFLISWVHQIAASAPTSGSASTSVADPINTLYAYLPQIDSPTTPYPTLSLIHSLLKDPSEAAAISTESAPTTPVLHYNSSGAHANDAWPNRASKKITAAAAERSLIRSVNLAIR